MGDGRFRETFQRPSVADLRRELDELRGELERHDRTIGELRERLASASVVVLGTELDRAYGRGWQDGYRDALRPVEG